jgi:hypothetical protein
MLCRTRPFTHGGSVTRRVDPRWSGFNRGSGCGEIALGVGHLESRSRGIGVWLSQIVDPFLNFEVVL